VEVNRAVAETTFVQQFEVHADVVVGEGTFTATRDDGHEEQLVRAPRAGSIPSLRAFEETRPRDNRTPDIPLVYS